MKGELDLNGAKYVQQFKKGSLEMILLCIIGKKETYGYEIITELNKSSEVLGFAREGTVYPILYRLTEAGLLQTRLAPSAANGGSKKFYSLTSEGRLCLEEQLCFWRQFADCVDGYISGYREQEEEK